MKTSLITGINGSTFEDNLNFELKQLHSIEKDVVDIKFSTVAGISTSDSYIVYSALIIYRT